MSPGADAGVETSFWYAVHTKPRREDTVRAHLKGIFAKLRVHDRTAAVAEALRRRLIE